MCFPFTTKTLNDLLSFSIYLLDDNNNGPAFPDGEKKISILNFRIDIFLTLPPRAFQKVILK